MKNLTLDTLAASECIFSSTKNTKLMIQLIENATTAELNRLLEKDNTTPIFMSLCFMYAAQNFDDASFNLLLNNVNCPLNILKSLQWYKAALFDQSDALALLELRCLDDEINKEWQQLDIKKPSDINEIYKILYPYLSDTTYHHPVYNSYYFISEYSFSLNYFFIPHFILENIKPDLNLPDLCKLIELARPEVIHEYINDKRAKVRQSLAGRTDLSIVQFNQLAQDKNVSVKKTLIMNPATPTDILLNFVKDTDERVIKSLQSHSSLPSVVEQALLEKKTAALQLDIPTITIKQALDLYKAPNTTAKTIAAFLKHPDPFIRAVGGFHHLSGEEYFDALMQEDEHWTKVSAALRTRNPIHLQTLFSTLDPDIHLNLAYNPHISKALALKLTNDRRSEVAQSLAAQFYDDEDVLQAALKKELARPNTKSGWAKNVIDLRDPETPRAVLDEIMEHKARLPLVVNKGMVRHPNCVPSLYRTLGYYLPDDANKNPNKEKKLSRSAKGFNGYDNERIESAASYDGVFQCITDLLLQQYDTPYVRTLSSCFFINRCLLQQHILSDDVHFFKRLVETNKHIKYTRFIYEGIARQGSLAVKRLLVTNIKKLPQAILDILSQDKDAGLQKLLSEYKGNITKSAPSYYIDENDPKSLGDSSSRVHFARNSSDIKILTLLTKDTVKQVRLTLAKRDSIPDAIVRILAKDKDQAVKIAALTGRNRRWTQSELINLLDEKEDKVLTEIYKLLNNIQYRHELTDTQRLTLHNNAVNIAINDAYSSQTRCYAIKAAEPCDTLTQLYPTADPDINNELHAKITDSALLERIVFDIQRNATDQNTAHYQYKNQFKTLLHSPSMTLELAEQFKQMSSDYLYMMIENSHPDICLFGLRNCDIKQDKQFIISAKLSLEQVKEILSQYSDMIDMYSLSMYAHCLDLPFLQIYLSQPKKDLNWRTKPVRLFEKNTQLSPEVVDYLIRSKEKDYAQRLAQTYVYNTEQINYLMDTAKDHYFFYHLIDHQALTIEQEARIAALNITELNVDLAECQKRTHTSQTTHPETLTLLSQKNGKAAKIAIENLNKRMMTA
ncbi:hypothetical protein [Algibacillus agarilyticus]|uniref:hypothetical protein n=1 Tax=Algibacillus agarilyticus TaxID=2234133 RepID=UPI000DD0CFE4|nr:hypothetical protein [Algibacillus agarilyticus]